MSTEQGSTNASRQKMNRRKMLKKAGIGLVAGAAVGAPKMAGGSQLIDTSITHTGHLAMWTHGNSVSVEHPQRMGRIERRAFHARAVGKPGTTNWFHFAVPTPVITAYWKHLEGLLVVDGSATVFRRYRLITTFVSFNTGSRDARVKMVRVHDGNHKIAEFGDLNLFGKQGIKEFKLPETLEVWQGICVSALVEYKDPATWVDFISAGADFFIIH